MWIQSSTASRQNLIKSKVQYQTKYRRPSSLLRFSGPSVRAGVVPVIPVNRDLRGHGVLLVLVVGHVRLGLGQRRQQRGGRD